MGGFTRRAFFLSASALGAFGLPRRAGAEGSSIPPCQNVERLHGWLLDTSLIEDPDPFEEKVSDSAIAIRISDSVTWHKEGQARSISLVIDRHESGTYRVSVTFREVEVEGREIGKDQSIETALGVVVGDRPLLYRRPNAPGATEFDLDFDAEHILTASPGTELKVSLFVERNVAAVDALFPIGDVPAIVAAAEASLETLRQQHAEAACEAESCFLTTATCHRLALPDDCFELTMLRRLRDEVLARTPEGRTEIAAYYALAPRVMRELAPRWRTADWMRLYAGLVLPCALLAWAGLHRPALARYRRFVRLIEDELDSTAVPIRSRPPRRASH